MISLKYLKLLAAGLVLFSGFATAHVELYDASPAAGGMLESAPEELFLSFSGDVRIVKLKLTDAKGKGVDFGFKPVVEATDEMRWALPSLAAGKYTVQWTVMGEDGHTFQDSYGFHVHGAH
ncbi:copper resistance protein CopC [Alteromonas sp. ZYF713]|nr:copper resistance protein CopC [Alteromonas sp. ZYF713]